MGETFDIQYEKAGTTRLMLRITTKERVNQHLERIVKDSQAKNIQVTTYNLGGEVVKTTNANWEKIDAKRWADLYPDMPIRN